MSLIVKNTSGPKLPLPEEGSYAALCVMLVDIGIQHVKYKDAEKDVPQVVIVWELAGETVEIGNDVVPRTVSKTYTLSLHDRSGLRKDLKSWRGREFTEEELLSFNLCNILGAPCMIQIVHNKTETGVYANIASIMSIPRGMQKPVAQTPLVAFDIDTAEEDELENLPNWLKEKVRTSETWIARNAGKLSEEPDEENDEDIPF